MHVCMLSHSVMSDSLATAWSIARLASLPMEFSGKNTGVAWHSSQPRDQTHIFCVSCVGRQILYH